MKSFWLSLFLLFSSGLLSAQYYYIPDNGSTLLLFSKKGDFKISTNLPSHEQINIQTGYSPLKSLSFSLSYFKHSTTKGEQLPSTFGKTFTASIGAYAFLKKQSDSSRNNAFNKNTYEILVDTYVGYARSDIFNAYISETTSSLNYQKLFLSLGTHFRIKKLALSHTIKLSLLDYKSGVVDGTPEEEEIFPIDFKIVVNEPYLLLESDLRLHFGPEKIRGFVGLVKVYDWAMDKTLLGDRDLVFSAGINIGINEWY